MSIHLLLLTLIALPFLGSLVAVFLPTHARNAGAWLAGVIALANVGILAFLYPLVTYGGVARAEIKWLPAAGLNFVVRLDGFAWLFALLVASVGFLVILYARYYMRPEDPVPRMFSFLLAFMGSMLGVVLSGNLIQIVFFWELTSLCSFLLIGYWHQNANARDGARTALVVTAVGGLCLFAGVLILGNIVGSYDLDRVLAAGDLVRSHNLYLPALILVLLGALTKSAQFPFYFWLPRAMAAPTPVSAYLHSATMVKAGVFLLARLWPVLAGTNYWVWIVATTGLVTFAFAAFRAVFQQDLKGILAYSTISHLGLITLLLGLDTPLAVVAAIFHMMNHATFKASLFMAAGIIDHETGTRDIRRLSGLYHFMPITATLAMVAAAAMAGVPLLNGFLSKEMFFAETISTHNGSFVDDALPYFATLAAMFTVAYSLRFIRDVFFGPPPVDLPHTPHEPPHWMRFPVEILVVICLVVGIFPAVTIGPFLHTAVFAVLGLNAPAYSLVIWHGFTLPLLMSLIAMFGGIALYALLHTYVPNGIVLPAMERFTGKPIFSGASNASVRWLFDLFNTRRLQPQLRLLVCVALVAALVPLYGRDVLPERFNLSTVDIAFALMWLVGVICAVATAYQAKYHRLAALILMGGVGLITCVTFVWLSAPDLAMTQLLVEIVTTVLILLGLRWLPKRLEEIPPEPGGVIVARFGRLRDLTLSVASGLGLSVIAYAMMMRTPPDGIARFFLERAQTEGGGANVVNVILVDFRGYDTLGEITVLGVVALSVYALLRRFRPAPESIEIPEQQRIQNEYDTDHPDRKVGDTIADYLMVPSVIMRLLFPVIGTMAVFLLVRGHDLPGGGFVAGLTLAVTIILQYMAGGTTWIESRLRIPVVRWMAIGLLLSGGAGAAAWLAGMPFLTSHTFDIDLPIIGTLHGSSVYVFDAGVFALVFGATVLMLIAIAHQTLRTQRRPKVTAKEAAGTE
jgi:multicomponent K+:H+ antiporter subunit A